MKHHLLAGAGLSALILALAPLAHAAEADTVSTDVEAVVIYGEGQSRQVQTVRAEQLSDAVAGVSPLKVVDMLPGVTFQSSDPFGAYEWSTRISIRGFNQNQLGFTLDGVPLGDMSYGNYNGLHISRAIATEDVTRSNCPRAPARCRPPRPRTSAARCSSSRAIRLKPSAARPT